MMFRNASQKRLLIPQLPSATRSSEVNVRGGASQSLCSQCAVCCQNPVVAERVGESKFMLGHTYRSGICAQVSSIFWFGIHFVVCLKVNTFCRLSIVYQHKFWNIQSNYFNQITSYVIDQKFLV